ncbi:UBX domain-containing protein 1, partial [Striga asiatica]
PIKTNERGSLVTRPGTPNKPPSGTPSSVDSSSSLRVKKYDHHRRRLPPAAETTILADFIARSLKKWLRCIYELEFGELQNHPTDPVQIRIARVFSSPEVGVSCFVGHVNSTVTLNNNKNATPLNFLFTF